MVHPIPFLNTPRLSLRPFQSTDAEILHRIYQEEGVLRYFPNPVPPPRDRVDRWLAGQRSHWEKYGYGNWGIVPAGGYEMIGWVGLQFLPELNETEVGFVLGRDYWGKGYATEAARKSLQFGFERVRLQQIIALVHPDNIASRRVIEKCGMQYLNSIFLWGIDLQRYQLSAAPGEPK